MTPTNKPEEVWTRLDALHKRGIEYIIDRKEGKVTSLKTPWRKFDDIGMGGLEWGTITTIGGRSGDGKTAILLQITRNLHKLNSDKDFAILDFQFEMTAEKTAMREFAAFTHKSIKELGSVVRDIDDATIDQLKAYSQFHQHRDIYQVDRKMTVPQIRKTIVDFYRKFNKPVIVTIDHSYLVQVGDEKSELAMLHNLGSMMTELKKHLPCLFIVLSQMKRDVEDILRRTPGKAGNYPTSSDFYGGDALYNHSDIMIAIDRPYQKNVVPYGPQEFMVGPNHVVLHVLKARDGSPDKMLFFEADYAKMELRECPPPNCNKPIFKPNP